MVKTLIRPGLDIGVYLRAGQKSPKHSAHRTELAESTLCGCFYCCATFVPRDIADWIDKDPDGHGQTGLCPRCGIDSVIGDKSGADISKEILAKMKMDWFES